MVSAATALTCAIAACSSSSSTEPSLTDDGGDGLDASGHVATCPKTAPQPGTGCTQPEGTTCAFGVCDGVYSVCSGGLWQKTPVTPVPSGCPEGVPTAGSTCPLCFSADASCLYQQACATDASAVRASCMGQSWHLANETCALDAGAAGADASDAGDAGD